MTPVPVTRGCAWRGDFASGHSLAVVNDGLVGALETRGVDVERLPPDAAQLRSDAIGVAAHWPPLWEPPTDGPFVVYQPWEFGEIPALWAERIRTRVDEVWTASEYSRRSFLAAGLAEQLVHVVPNGVDLERFAPDGPVWPLPRRAGTVFLFVGGTTFRKGIDVLLAAYGKAFGTGDDVLLVIKGFGADSYYRGQTAEAAIGAFAQQPGAPAVLAIDDHLPHEDVPSLYRAADCLVQPYRGEGFCLPALEALACGTPIVSTAGGPTDEFAGEACAWRIPSNVVPLPPNALTGEMAPAGGGHLLEPDVDALADLFRVAADPDARAAKAAQARRHAERYSWANAATIADNRLERLAGIQPILSVAPAVIPGANRLVLAVDADWDVPTSWRPAVDAYAQAFAAGDDTTLVLPAADEAKAVSQIGAYLDETEVETERLADIVVADTGSAGVSSLALAVDAFVGSAHGAAALRARHVLPPDPAALRSLLVP